MKIEINKKITVKKAAKERLNRLSRSLAAFVLLFSLIFSPFNSAFSFAEDNESSGFLNFKTGLNATAFFVFKTINSWFQISDSDSEQKKSQTEGSFLQSQTETIAEGGRATPALPLAPADSSAAETQISAGQKLIKKIAQLSPPAILPQALSVQSAGISQEELARELNILENSLKAEIYRMASQLAPAAPAAQTPASNFQAIALSQRIDNLDQVTISNATISKSTFSGSTGTITDLTATDLTATDFTTANLSASNNSYFTALSQGSIPFIGASGLLLQDNTNLFWDDTNNRLGLGTITPNYTLDVSGDIRTSATLYASTTEITNLTITTASSTQLTVSDKSWLGTVLGGTWQGTSITDTYIDDDITLTNITQITNRAISDTSGTLLVGRGGTGLTTATAGYALIGLDADTLQATSSIFIKPDGNVGIGAIAPTSTLQVSGGDVHFQAANGAPGLFYDYANNRMGLGTTTPAQDLSVDGNIYITGALGVGVATTTAGTIETSGDVVIGGNLQVGGNATIIGDTSSDTLVINSTIKSNLIPDQNATRDLGSTAYYWDDVYADKLVANNISAASTTIAGTQSESFTINSNNSSSDAEDMDIIFFRGTVVPNALIAWKSDVEKFDFNQPVFIQNDSSTTTVITLDIKGAAGQTADLFRVISDSGDSYLTISATGKSTMTNASTTQLTVSDKSWLGTVLGGTWQGTIIGDDYITKTGDWSGTVSGSYTGFGNDFYTYFNATSTNALAEGASNLYWTQNRWDQAMTATTTLPTITTLLNLTNASTTQLTVSDKSWIGTVLGGTWQGTSITDTYIDDDITLTNITQITSRAISDTSGTLLVGRGGTGLTTLTSGSILYADGDDNLTALASSTDGYVLVLDANGRPSWNDFTGTGKVVYDTSPTFTTGITVPADSISHTELSEGDAFTWTGSHSFSGAGDIDLPADSVDAGDVNFNYAASGSEGGSATSGDSASAFFSTGTIEHEYGGLQADVGSYAGLLSITGGATAQVDSVSELNALLLGESVASTTNVWADAYISSASTWNAKWDALSDISLAHKSIFVGDSSGHPVATSTITVLDSGFVGIGTTVIGTPNQLWSSGTPIVEIGGVTSNMYSLLNLAGKDNDDGANVAVITFNNMENSDASDATSQNLAAIYAQTETSDSNAGDDSGGHLVFLTKPEAGTAAERMRIDSDGNIGIGTTTPTALTHILQTGATDAFRVDDELADTSPFVIDDDGNVGIGTDSPTSKLHLPSENDETTPTLSFGDGDSGFYERNDDELAVSLGGVGKFYFGSSWVRYLGNGWLLKNSNTSSTNPAFSFEGDVDTGIGRAGANELSLITGATERIRIDNSGNVGIGTTTPQAALDIQKPATGDYLNISNDLHGDIVTVNSSGNLGIGTTAPTAKLDIDGTSKFGGIINTGGNWISGDGGAEGISVDSDGKVGIGTTEPEAKLHMKSASAVIAKFEGTGSNDAFLSFDVPATRNALMEFKENDVGKWYIGNVAANDRFEFHNGTSEVFSILSSGNVGIGTTAPIGKLDVRGGTVLSNEPSSARWFFGTKGSSFSDGHFVVVDESTTQGGTNQIFRLHQEYASAGHLLTVTSGNTISSPTNTVLDVLANGNIGIGTTTPQAALDIQKPATGDYFNISNDLHGDIVTITDAGNIGIGTTAPSTPLHIASDFTGQTANSQFYITGATDSNLQLRLGYQTDDDYGFIQAIHNTVLAKPLALQPSGGNIGIGTTTPGAALDVQKPASGDYFNISNDLHGDIVTITDAGNVGIGTTSPSEKLHVVDAGYSAYFESTSGGAGIQIIGGGAGEKTWGLADNADVAGTFSIKNLTDGITGVAIKSDGNVGIGTTTPQTKFHVVGDGAVARLSSVDYKLFQIAAEGTGANYDKGQISIYDTGTRDIYLSTAGDSYINAGNVGIGTTEPGIGGGYSADKALTLDGGTSSSIEDTFALEIGGSTNTDGRYAGMLAFYNADNSGAAAATRKQLSIIRTVVETSDSNAGDDSGGHLVFVTKPEAGVLAERVRITSSGNVGIGTTSPSRLFHVSHATTNDVAQFESLDEKAGIILADPTGSVALETIGGDFRVDVTGDGNYEFYVKEDGNIGIGTTGPDEKLHVKGGVCITDSDTCAGSPGDGDIWILGNMSALSVTDRTPIFEGDALSEIKKIKGKDGKIDHSTLPEFVRAEIEKPIFEKREVEEEFFDEELNKTIIKLVEKDTQIGTRVATERNLGNMISMNVRAIQQLAEKMGNKVFKGDVINYNAGQLALENDSGEPQMKIAFDAENFAELQVNAVGDLTITTAGADLNLPNDNLSVCSGGACPAAARQMNGAGNLTVENTAFVAGALGVGTSSPDRVFNVFETAARPQMKISYDTDNYAELQVSAAGDLALSARGGDIRLPNENLAICSGGACPASAGLLTGAGNLTVENTVFVAGALGVGTARPGRALDVFETRTSPQMRISYDEDLYSELNVSATGDLIISARGGDVSILNENFKICSENGCPAEANLLNGAGNLVVENSILALGGIGINTASPSYTLDVNGTLRAYGITDASDERLKTNIQNLSELGRETSKLNLNLDVSRPSGSSGLNGTLAKINNLRGVTFHWRNADLGTARQIGLIAQELEIEYPELVSTDNKGFKSIQYGKFTAVLLEAVKELFSMSRTIEYRSANLENRTADLEKQNKLLAAKTEKLEERLRALEQILVQ